MTKHKVPTIRINEARFVVVRNMQRVEYCWELEDGLKVAIIHEGGAYTVVRQKRQMSNRRGRIGMRKEWIRYPSATCVPAKVAGAKVDEVLKVK